MGESGYKALLNRYQWILALCFVLLGCGQHEVTMVPAVPVSYGASSVVWEGYADQDAHLLEGFNWTMSCLENHGYAVPAGYPYVVELDGYFACGQVDPAVGCTVLGWGRIYVSLKERDRAFTHELVHWATGIGDEGHGAEPFLSCGE